jgi:hypothetical protein
MTKRAYKLAALFFFVLAVGCTTSALYMWHQSLTRAGLWYSIIAFMSFVLAGAIRLAASQKT